MLAAICEQSMVGSPSFNDIAIHIESNSLHMPSRQAVANRCNEAFEIFIQSVLEHVMAGRTSAGSVGVPHDVSFRDYKRVLVQDSTIIMLPKALFPEYSGVSNGHSTVCNARIQATYDLLSGRLVAFSIDPYSKNDMAAAPELELQPGDLVLRDRGYLTAGEIQRHRASGADCIYRHITGMTYLDETSGRPIDLPALLRKQGKLDLQVRLNNDAGTKVRLVAAAVDEETANLRRMKAKKGTKGHNPSAAVLELMDWTIFITTIPKASAGFKALLGIYGLRWRIEVIFKAWKSHLKFDVVHKVSKRQLTILLKGRLLVIAACANMLYRRCEQAVFHACRRRLSLLKFVKYVTASPANLVRLFRLLSGTREDRDALCKVLARYCCYDKRKRRNFNETWESLA